MAGQPYRSLTDFWHRASVSRPVVERLVLAGGFDSLYGFGVRDREAGRPAHRRQQVTRRDLLLQIGELDRWSRSGARASSSGQLSLDLMGLGLGRRARPARRERGRRRAWTGPTAAACRSSPTPSWCAPSWRCSAWTPAGTSSTSTEPFLAALGAVPAGELLGCRSGARGAGGRGEGGDADAADPVGPAGGVRDPRRRHGCTDSTFFEDAQGPYAATVFHSWLLVSGGCCAAPGRAGCRCGPPERGSCRRCTRHGRPTGSTGCGS